MSQSTAKKPERTDKREPSPRSARETRHSKFSLAAKANTPIHHDTGGHRADHQRPGRRAPPAPQPQTSFRAATSRCPQRDPRIALRLPGDRFASRASSEPASASATMRASAVGQNFFIRSALLLEGPGFGEARVGVPEWRLLLGLRSVVGASASRSADGRGRFADASAACVPESAVRAW